MTNFELKKDCVCEPAPNLALDSIVIVDGRRRTTGRKDFVLWYLRQFGVKRLRRENHYQGSSVYTSVSFRVWKPHVLKYRKPKEIFPILKKLWIFLM